MSFSSYRLSMTVLPFYHIAAHTALAVLHTQIGPSVYGHIAEGTAAGRDTRAEK
jgi:hypothetical protein